MSDLPRVRGERRLPIYERAPPEATFAYVPGITSLAAVRAQLDEGVPHVPTECIPPFPLYLSRPALRQIVRQGEDDARAGRETMGLLAGRLWTWRGVRYGVALDAVTGDLQADAVSVRFTGDRAVLFDALDRLGYDYVLLGWYHSHPGYSCFLSETDVATSTRMFNQEHHRAVVIDPLERDLRAFQVVDGRAVDTAWAVFEPKEASA